jgi:hypothetical protein
MEVILLVVINSNDSLKNKSMIYIVMKNRRQAIEQKESERLILGLSDTSVPEHD